MKQMTYECPVCGFTDKWARIYLLDDDNNFEEPCLIVGIDTEIYRNLLLIAEDNNYYAIKDVSLSDVFDFCLNCETVFS